MRQSFPALRRGAVALVAIFSVMGAMALVWLLGRKEFLGQLSNAQLVGMIGLALLPPVTIAAWELDRRSVRRTMGAMAEVPSVKAHSATVRIGRARHRRRIVHERAPRPFR